MGELLSVVPIVDDTKWYTYWISVQNNVTERVNYSVKLEEEVNSRTRELNRSNDKLTQFASVVLHDLKTPLRRISSHLQLLQLKYADVLDEEGIDYIDQANKNASNAFGLVEGILKYSLIHSNKEEQSQVDQNAIVNELIDMYKQQIVTKSIAISSTDLPKLRANSIQIKQLFQHLIANALKLNTNMNPTVEIRSSEIEGGYQFEIRDDGIGIPDSDLDTIFNLFSRVHSTDNTAGHRVGSAIFKEIVKKSQWQNMGCFRG